MRSVLHVIRHGLRLVPLVLVLALVVPGSGVRPTTIGLMKVQPAEAYDFADGVVWTLVLGEDAEGQTDLIQLLGINFRNGNAAAIGIPRDSWFELSPEVGEERINKAYATGGAELAADAVERLVGIAPDYVLVTDTDGFLAMVGTLGEVEVDSEFAFAAEDSDLQVHRGVNTFSPQEALDFATTRTTLARGDFDRSLNHQALLLGLLEQLRARDDEPGFIETLGLDAVGGIDTGNLSPLDLYRLLNALTSVDPGKASGCIVLGTDATSPLGGAIVIPDLELAQRYGDDVRTDARFDQDCPEGA
jgi:LCP family protein required for cell wall assembly